MYLILGFTKRTSYSLARFLLAEGYTLVIADQQKSLEQEELIAQLSFLGIVINELGSQEEFLLTKYPITKIFISPGVPRAIPLVQKALSLSIEVLNDIEYFYQKFPSRCYIAITGTDGKTTVTTWLGSVLALQQPVVLVGNIGIPIFEYADECFCEYLFIIELSSFQLESLRDFCPTIALITNIHADHLDRYSGMEEYVQTKKKIFFNQNTEHKALINDDDVYILSFISEVKAQKIGFSLEKKSDYYEKDGWIYDREEALFSIKDLQVIGRHNVQNALIVSIVAKEMGVSSVLINKGLREFQGVSHRLEFLGIKKTISFYNDSKATTVEAIKTALESFDRPVILLAGGRSKGMDFSTIKDIVQAKTKKVFGFGELAQELSLAWEGVGLCVSMQEAFQRALQYAQPNDVVVLSPGGSSFDEFSSYVHRGEYFTKLVENLE